ncbi:E3 ubiquitin-protein ligase SIRP1-like [Andrographis paniculata]|uniref:E3 ubiquitin-protein ligase SIRP1-like n=1 Tax=Andrographis paniculata TaxID=175694 RepID=UPI0021E86E14|nr:E3 ubiquitin-protein ligase SIRP1-like [Andrographis paniculata]
MEESEASSSRYWCHMCSQTVNPIMEVDSVKCPICQSGFVEEMSSASAPNSDPPLELGSDSDRALSLWAPILLGMISNPRRRRRIRNMEFEEEDNNEDDNNTAAAATTTTNNDQSVLSIDSHGHQERDTELDRELESIIRRRRRRSSAAILQLLQGIRAGILAETANLENMQQQQLQLEGGDRENDNRGERVILINPFNQTIIVQGSYDSQNRIPAPAPAPIGSFGDYFIGPSLDLLLQHLSENDPNRYGTPPAQKEAVEALPKVKVEETLQCSVCLDECEAGTEMKEMPCKHKFHSECILPWLELHSSCPVCRHQLPCDESKLEATGEGGLRNNTGTSTSNDGNNNGGGGGDRDRQYSAAAAAPLPWPFSSLFSSSISISRSPRSVPGNSSIASTSSEPTTNGGAGAGAGAREEDEDNN